MLFSSKSRHIRRQTGGIHKSRVLGKVPHKMSSAKWGYHLTLDCMEGDKEKIGDRYNIRRFVKQLVKDIDMVPYGEPWIKRFATHDPIKGGYSLCQMIQTSNITGHFVDHNGNFYIDVFSCKPFDCSTVVQLVETYFHPLEIKQNFTYRNA
jgi:S-adenosylmethionine/arginine decarboxylase-like enzyme